VFDQPYNRDLPEPRAHDWDAVVELVVEELDARSRQLLLPWSEPGGDDGPPEGGNGDEARVSPLPATAPRARRDDGRTSMRHHDPATKLTTERFVRFMVECEVLRFGDFVAKSGRRMPYFIDAGRYRTGTQLATLGTFYAAAIEDAFGDDVDVLFGPAYKGIPLAVDRPASPCHGITTARWVSASTARRPRTTAKGDC
jgi:hypothetical protein